MTANHTPGPWEIKGQDIVGSGPNGYICTWSGNSADARLVAAAPDLLQALEHVLENYKYNNNEGLGMVPIIQAKAAIKKARGEE